MSNGIAGVLTYSVTNVLKCGLKSKKMGNLMIKNSKYWPRNLSRVGKSFIMLDFLILFRYLFNCKQKNDHNLLAILHVFIQQKKVNCDFSMSLIEFQETN